MPTNRTCHEDTTHSERPALERSGTFVDKVASTRLSDAHADELLHAELQRRLRECEQLRCAHRQHLHDTQQALVEAAGTVATRESCCILCCEPCMERKPQGARLTC